MKFYAGAVAFLTLLAACTVAPLRSTRRAPNPYPRPRASETDLDGPTRHPAESTDRHYVPADPAKLTGELLYESNYARVRSGAPPLEYDPLLARAARRYSRELARRRTIEHVSATPGRHTFRARIAAEGAHARIAGENLARLTSSQSQLAERVVELWLESPGHRRNLLDDIFRRTGIGVWLGQDGIWYVVQLYATRT